MYNNKVVCPLSKRDDQDDVCQLFLVSTLIYQNFSPSKFCTTQHYGLANLAP